MRGIRVTQHVPFGVQRPLGCGGVPAPHHQPCLSLEKSGIFVTEHEPPWKRPCFTIMRDATKLPGSQDPGNRWFRLCLPQGCPASGPWGLTAPYFLLTSPTWVSVGWQGPPHPHLLPHPPWAVPSSWFISLFFFF